MMTSESIDLVYESSSDASFGEMCRVMQGISPRGIMPTKL